METKKKIMTATDVAEAAATAKALAARAIKARTVHLRAKVEADSAWVAADEAANRAADVALYRRKERMAKERVRIVLDEGGSMEVFSGDKLLGNVYDDEHPHNVAYNVAKAICERYGIEFEPLEGY